MEGLLEESEVEEGGVVVFSEFVPPSPAAKKAAAGARDSRTDLRLARLGSEEMVSGGASERVLAEGA